MLLKSYPLSFGNLPKLNANAAPLIIATTKKDPFQSAKTSKNVDIPIKNIDAIKIIPVIIHNIFIKLFIKSLM